MPEPIENLLRLQQLAEDQGEAQLAAWLGEGLRRFLFQDEPLERALEANGGQGKRTARRRFLEQQRNRALRAAWRLCEGVTPWRRTLALQQEINRFQAILWPRWRDLEDAPAEISALRRELFDAHRCGSVPTSASQLHDLCTSPMNDPYPSC